MQQKREQIWISTFDESLKKNQTRSKVCTKKCVVFQVKVSLGSKRKSLKVFFLCFWNYQFETQVEFASLLKNLEEQETNNYEVCIMKQVVPSHFSSHFSHRRRYWFSPATVSTFVAEICDKGGSAALVSSPSVYFSLPEALFGADGWWIRGILEEHTSRNLNLDNKNHGRL